MSEVYIDLEISLPQSKFVKFKELADNLNLSVPETMERCMFEKCEEYLTMFKENTPEKIEGNGRTSTEDTRERI